MSLSLLELNQYQCISTIPLGVSLLIEGGGGMEPAILKPVIKLFTSCVANNSKRRERERERMRHAHIYR